MYHLHPVVPQQLYRHEKNKATFIIMVPLITFLSLFSCYAFGLPFTEYNSILKLDTHNREHLTPAARPTLLPTRVGVRTVNGHYCTGIRVTYSCISTGFMEKSWSAVYDNYLPRYSDCNDAIPLSDIEVIPNLAPKTECSIWSGDSETRSGLSIMRAKMTFNDDAKRFEGASLNHGFCLERPCYTANRKGYWFSGP